MGPLARFLLALTNLVRSGGIKKISDAIRFAKQEFGEVTPLLKKQIQKVFESAKKPVVGKPGKKEGAVIPMVKEGAKKAEGIETLEDSSPLMDRLDKKVEEMRLSDDDPMGDLEQILNPKRPGGSLDPAIGITRGLARRILDKKGIEIGKKDPIDVFTDTFGEAITDVKNLADEMVEADEIGRNLKSPDELLEIEGLFDLEIPTNPQKGLTDEELLKLEKQIKEEKILEDFDPTFRKPNATGGLTRTSYAMGGGRDTGTIGEMKSKLGVLSNKVRRTSKRLEERGEPAFLEMGKGPVLPEDPTKPVNPFGPKPTGPVLPDKSMMAEFSLKDYMDEFERVFPEMIEKRGTQEYMDMLEDYFRGLASKDRTSSRVQAASGGLAEILKV